jgi:hypothetical protein
MKVKEAPVNNAKDNESQKPHISTEYLTEIRIAETVLWY